MSEHDQPLTDTELQLIVNREKFRNRLALLAGGIQVIAIVAFVIISVVLLSSVGQQKALSNRQDCKTLYNSILAKPVTDRDDLQAQVSALNGSVESQLGESLLDIEHGGKISQPVIDAFSVTKDALDVKRVELEASIIKVQSLPSIATASNHGFTFNNIHYPACPSTT